MTLLEYVTSLQDTGLSEPEIFAKAQEWKKKNQSEVEEVIETPVEEVKTEVVVEEGVPAATTPVTPESSDSGSGTSYSMFDEEAIASQSLDIINQRALNYKEQQDFDDNVDGVKTKAILKQLPLNSKQRTDYYIDKNLATDDTIDEDYYSRATGVSAPNNFLIEEGQKNLKGSEQLNPLSKQPDPLGLDVDNKKVPENFFDDLMEDFDQESLSPSVNVGSEFVEGYIKDNDLDLKYENLYFNKEKSTKFVDKFYGGAESLKEFGVNPIDFEGFLNRNGYADDYLKNLEEGEYEDTSIYGDENTLAGERALRKYLNLYVSKQDAKENKSYKLDQIVKKGQLIGLKSSKYGGVNSTVEDALNKVEVNTYFTTVDQKKQKNYISSKFTQSTQKDKEYLQAKIDYAKKLDERGDWYAAAANTGVMITEVGEGFLTGMRDLVNFGLDITGFDLAVDKDRNYQAEEQLAKDSSYYTTMTDAKTITQDGIEYAKDSKGNIYNVSAGYNVAGIMDNFQIENLNKKIENEGVKKTHNSLRGYLTIGGNVTGNVISQVIGQKGFGVVTKAARLKTLASVNGFKKVSDYKKMINLANSIGGKAKSAIRIPVKKSTADAMLFQGSYGAATGYNNTLAQAKQAGFNDAEAEALAFDAGQYMAVWYAATGPISDRTTWLDNVGGKLGIQKIIANALTEAKKTGTKNFSQTLKNQLTNLSYKLKSKGYNFSKEGLKETLQEDVQQRGEFLWINPTLNTKAKTNFLQDTYSNDEAISTSVLSFATGGLLSQMKIPSFKPNTNAQISNYTYVAKNADKAKIELDKLVKSGFATQAEADQLMENAKAILNQTPKMPKWLKGDYVLNVAKLMQQKQDIENQKKSTAKVFHGPLDDDIENLDLEIDAFVRQSADEKRSQLQKGVSTFVDAVAKASDKDVDIQNFETTTEANAYRQELQDKGNTVYQSDNYGDFVLDKEGNITVIIDDQVNTEDNVVSTEVHEGGHILVSATVKKDPKAAAKLGNSLLEELSNSSNITINNDKIAQRLSQYVSKGVSTADVMEEVLMFTSQALIDGDIEFNETSKTKIGDLIRRTLQNVFGIKVKFKDGESVINFLRDYNKTIESGKVSKGLIKTAVEGGEVTIKDSDTDAAKKLGRTELVVNEETGVAEDIETTPKKPDSTSKASQRVYQEVESMKDALVDPKTKKETAFAIANNPDMFNEVDRRLKFDADKIAREDVIRDFLFDDKRGLLGLLNKYDEKRNDSIVGYLNSSTPGGKLLDARLFEFFKDDPRYGNIVQSESQEGVSEKMQNQTSTDGNFDEKTKLDNTPAKIIPQINVTKFGPAKNKKVALEKIIKIEKGKRPNFKTLNNKYFNEVSEEIFGIEGKKVRGNVSLNYGKGKKVDYSEANALQNIFKNDEDVRNLIKTMPPYNVASSETIINEQGESVNVSTDTKGRAIGINPKVLKTFYQKVNGSIPGISNPKGRSLGKSSQTDVFELKPEFKGAIDNDVITALQSSVGVNKGTIKRSY